MPLHLTLGPRDGYPVYLQIVRQISRAIAIGVIAPGEQLPTIKHIAAELIVNPSTVAKALRDLERLGLIETSPGHGSFVSNNAVATATAHTAETSLAEALDHAVRDARSLGIDGEILRDLFNRAHDAWYAGNDGEPQR